MHLAIIGAGVGGGLTGALDISLNARNGWSWQSAFPLVGPTSAPA